MLVVTFVLTCIFNTFLYIWLKSHLVCDECCPWSRTLLGRCLGRSFCALSEPKAWGTDKRSVINQSSLGGKEPHAHRHLRSWWSGVGKWPLITTTGFMGQRRNLLPLTGHHKLDINPNYYFCASCKCNGAMYLYLGEVKSTYYMYLDSHLVYRWLLYQYTS